MRLDQKTEQKLRMHFDRVIGDTRCVLAPSLKDVLMVGAFRPISEYDEAIFGDFAKSCKKLKLKPPYGFSVSTSNVYKEYGNNDFLKNDFKCSAVIIIDILDPPKPARHYMTGENDILYRGVTTLSPLHWMPEIWQKKTLETGAGLVFVYGGYSEINGDKFYNKPEFKLVDRGREYATFTTSYYDGPELKEYC